MLGKVVRNECMRQNRALRTPADPNADSERGIENFNGNWNLNSAQWPGRGQPIIDVDSTRNCCSAKVGCKILVIALMDMYKHVGSR